MMLRVVSLIGTARPSPYPATAVLIPTTSPDDVASAPPELPGFSAASVWITLSMMRVVPPDRLGSDRPSALTTPAVTLPARPSGCRLRRPAVRPAATTRRPAARAAG